MRVSQNILSNTTLSNLNKNMSRMLALQEKLSTGREITRPTDGPLAFSQALGYRAVLDTHAQHNRNADNAMTWLSTTDSAIQEAGNILQRARELTVRGISDTMSGDARRAIANEVDELAKQMRAVGNSDLGGRFLFAGTDTTNLPYPDNGQDTNNTQGFALEMGTAVAVQYNTPGVDVFGRTGLGSIGQPSDPTNMFKLMSDLTTALRENNQAGVSAILPQLDERHQKFLTAQSVVGGKMNRLLLIKERLADQSLNINKLKSKTEDADMTSLITDLNKQDAVYRASLAAGSRVIQPTLVDFLR